MQQLLKVTCYRPHASLEKSPCSNEDPAQSKLNKIKRKKKKEFQSPPFLGTSTTGSTKPQGALVPTCSHFSGFRAPSPAHNPPTQRVSSPAQSFHYKFKAPLFLELKTLSSPKGISALEPEPQFPIPSPLSFRPNPFPQELG